MYAKFAFKTVYADYIAYLHIVILILH